MFGEFLGKYFVKVVTFFLDRAGICSTASAARCLSASQPRNDPHAISLLLVMAMLTAPCLWFSRAFGGTRVHAWSGPDALAQCPQYMNGTKTNSDSDLWNAMIVPLLPMRYQLRSMQHIYVCHKWTNQYLDGVDGINVGPGED